jgi:hypothetical protein
MSQSLDKNPCTLQKYEKTVYAWIIIQMSVLHGQKARVHIIVRLCLIIDSFDVIRGWLEYLIPLPLSQHVTGNNNFTWSEYIFLVEYDVAFDCY